MDRLRPVGSFLLLALVLLLGLRLLNMAAPVFFPEVLSGPFRLDSTDAASRYIDFEPLLPYFRPEELGARPVSIVASRRPYPRLVVVWRGNRFLSLSERAGGPEPRLPAAAVLLPGRPAANVWRDGGAHRAVARRGNVWIEIETDLTLRDVRRILDSLSPESKGGVR
jgi:hypothetical protein